MSIQNELETHALNSLKAEVDNLDKIRNFPEASAIKVRETLSKNTVNSWKQLRNESGLTSKDFERLKKYFVRESKQREKPNDVRPASQAENKKEDEAEGANQNTWEAIKKRLNLRVNFSRLFDLIMLSSAIIAGIAAWPAARDFLFPSPPPSNVDSESDATGLRVASAATAITAALSCTITGPTNEEYKILLGENLSILFEVQVMDENNTISNLPYLFVKNGLSVIRGEEKIILPAAGPMLANGGTASINGVRVTADYSSPIMILRVSEDSDLFLSGVRNGDFIIRVNGADVSNVDELSEALKDPSGKPIVVTFSRIQEGARLPRPVIGITLAQDTSNTVELVFKDSPAENAGLVAGDVILAVNGRTLSPLELTDSYFAKNFIPGESISLQVQRGSNLINLEIHLANSSEFIPQFDVTVDIAAVSAMTAMQGLWSLDEAAIIQDSLTATISGWADLTWITC